MSFVAAVMMLAQAAQLPPGYVLDPPPCPNAKIQCEPWERKWKSDPVVEPNPFDRFDAKRNEEPSGPGPHTLIVSDRDGMTRIDYATGAKCQRARDEIRRQVAPPPNTANVIYGPSSGKAFCVPR